MLINMREFIRASGTKGFRKSAIKVQVESPQGKQKTIAYGELSYLKPDKRQRRKRNYVTLTTAGRHGRRKFTFDVMKGTGSETISLGFHYDFDVLDPELVAKHVAFFRVCGFPINIIPINPSIIDRETSKKLDGTLEMLVKYYEQDFRKRISHAKAAYRRFIRSRHSKHARIRHRKV